MQLAHRRQHDLIAGQADASRGSLVIAMLRVIVYAGTMTSNASSKGVGAGRETPSRSPRACAG